MDFNATREEYEHLRLEGPRLRGESQEWTLCGDGFHLRLIAETWGPGGATENFGNFHLETALFT